MSESIFLADGLWITRDISGRLDSLAASDRLDPLVASDRLDPLAASDRLDSLGLSGVNIGGWAGFAATRDDGLFGSPGCLLPSTFADGLFGSPGCLLPSTFTDRLCISDGSNSQSSRQRFVWPGYCTKIVEFKQLS